MLTKSPLLWRKVNVKVFRSSDKERIATAKSFISGLPSCVTFIKLDFSAHEDLNVEELCVKLHQNCPLLEELNLAHCSLSNILPEVINFCTQLLQSLKKLVFHYCHFDDYSKTVELKGNSKIEVLDLYGCYFSHCNKTHFSKLLYLKELRLNRTDVDDTWFVKDTSFLNQLHVLDLGGTYITASTFLAIKRHGLNLKKLYICDVIQEDKDLDFNKPVFPHLKTICLFQTRVPCEFVVSLIQLCPFLENVYVHERLAESFVVHPFVFVNKSKSGIVKVIGLFHNHNVDYSHN